MIWEVAMDSKAYYLALFLVPIILLTSGCLPKCQPEDYPDFDVFLDSPSDGITLNPAGKPTFHWHHNENCRPEEFVLSISTGSGFNSFYTSGKNDSLKPNYPLQPAEYYKWHIIPVSPSNNLYGKWSENRSFETEGFCLESELVSPVLIYPPDGEVVDPYGKIVFDWNYPDDCEPRYYSYQFATDPDFQNIFRSGITDDKISSEYIFIPNCTTAYWRVAARAGNASSPWSEPFTFTRISQPTCWQNHVPSIDVVKIFGYVFEDICPATCPTVPEDVGLPLECAFGKGFGVHANGARSRGINGELGMSEVMVDLGAGPCPSVGLSQYETESNGYYYFLVQSPGEYCVSITKDQYAFPKPGIWKPGIWTLPLTDQLVTGQTFTVNPGDIKVSQSFGWDDYNVLIINFLVKLKSFCRAGDSIKYPAPFVLKEGQIVPIIARNGDANWFKAIVDGEECYVSNATGEPMQDPNELPLYPQLPPPPAPDKPTEGDNCSTYTNEGDCMSAGCTWNFVAGAPDFCSN